MPPEPKDDWDRVDEWTGRVGRWMSIGIPTWFVLLALFNKGHTGIPWSLGLAMATILAVAIAMVAERMAFGRRARSPLGPFGRGVLIWAFTFAVLALAMSLGGRSGAAVAVVPFFGASMVTALAEVSRRALRKQ